MVLPVHDIPGRLRFVLPALRANRRGAAGLRARVRAIDGVTSASANPLTGSLIVRYDGTHATREEIAASLLHFAPDIPRREPPGAGRASAIADIVVNAIVERIVESAVRVALAAVI
jgi:heavy-metal-associated domain-containing protein